MKSRRACELCSGEAALHCEPDSAFLCWACDARVHGANFLVARHPRRLLCLQCGAADPENRRTVSGPGFLPVRFICLSCSSTNQGEDDDDHGRYSSSDSESSSCCSSSLRSSMSSSCVSSAEPGTATCAKEGGAAILAVPSEVDGPIKAACSANSAVESDCSNPGRRQRRRRKAFERRDLDARTEAVLLSWCRRTGLDDVRAPRAAAHALAVGMRRMVAAAPFRLVAAAAVWFAAKLCYAEAAEGGRPGVVLLRRLVACSGVPAEFILVAEARLARALRGRHVGEVGEGWAECS